MAEELIFILQLIQIDFFTAFGFWTILYLIFSIFIRKPILNNIDEESNRFISFIGILFLLCWVVRIFVEFNILNQEEKSELLDRMSGKYWFGIWGQPLLWILITQLLRFKTVRKSPFLRVFFSVLLIFSIERIMIIIISFHSDYLPSFWTMYSEIGIYPSNLVLSLFLKIIVYLVFVGLFYLINKKLKSLKLGREKNH
jgi:molybdopterin-containing oxidoreductase family membrane subunit